MWPAGTAPSTPPLKPSTALLRWASSYQLVTYSIHSGTEGEDAQGEVVVKLRQGNHTVTGRGLSTDIFEASLKAYLNAVNKIIAQ